MKFQKNKPRGFDLVIGADGIHSNTRQLVFGDEDRFLQNLGLYLCVFTVPNYLNLDRVEMQYSELGRIAAVWSAQGEANMKACFGFTAPPVNLNDRAEQQQVIKIRYKDINWEVPKLLELMPEATDFYFDAAAQVHMSHWSKGRVALVGDAGYCASPMSGQGSSLAVIGAYVLAGELAQAKGDYQSAFNNYEKELSPFVKLNQSLGIKAAKLMLTQEKSTLGGWFLKQLMETAPGWLTKIFINRSTARITEAANSINLKDYG